MTDYLFDPQGRHRTNAGRLQQSLPDLRARSRAMNLIKLGKISNVQGMEAFRIAGGLSSSVNGQVVVNVVQLSGHRVFDLHIAPSVKFLDVTQDYSFMQGLLPSTTAALSKYPIGGSVTAQLEYANIANTLLLYTVNAAYMGIPSAWVSESYAMPIGFAYKSFMKQSAEYAATTE